MSYCRFSNESSIYMYPTGDHDIVCCLCKLSNDTDMVFDNPNDALNHVLLHKDKGDMVPDSVIKRLKKEIKEVEE